MMNSQQWWDGVKTDPVKFDDWLIRQYRGEVTAARRIRAVASHFRAEPTSERILQNIAVQEETHAFLVAGLLRDRGIVVGNVEISDADKRYWSEALKGAKDFDTACAVGAHAEAMRLERINVICKDAETPANVRRVFKQIQIDEVWHERAFRDLAGKVAMEQTKADHEAGRHLLGLEV
jgi:rubrerythrin